MVLLFCLAWLIVLLFWQCITVQTRCPLQRSQIKQIAIDVPHMRLPLQSS